MLFMKSSEEKLEKNSKIIKSYFFVSVNKKIE